MKTISYAKTSRFAIIAMSVSALVALTLWASPASAALNADRGDRNKSSISTRPDRPSGVSARSAQPQSDRRGGGLFGGQSSIFGANNRGQDSKPGGGGAKTSSILGGSRDGRPQTGAPSTPVNNSRRLGIFPGFGQGPDQRPTDRQGDTGKRQTGNVYVKPDNRSSRTETGATSTPADNSRRLGIFPGFGQGPDQRPTDRQGDTGKRQTRNVYVKPDNRSSRTEIGGDKRNDSRVPDRRLDSNDARKDTARNQSDHRGDSARIDNRRRADDRNSQDRNQSGSKWNLFGSHKRSVPRVADRVFQTRRDWRTHYRDHRYDSRPQYHNGFYFYLWGVLDDPYHYGNYCFTYVHGRTHQSLYFHYGLFPYIYAARLVIVPRPVVRYVYVPVNVYDDDYDYYLAPRVVHPNGYYLTSAAKRSLRQALDSIETAWEQADSESLMEHALTDKRIDVFFKGSYSYSVNYEDYRDMTRDAMETIDTSDFEFTSVRIRGWDEVVAYGRHTYYTSQDEQAKVYISYTLKRIDGKWYIREVGSSPDLLDN